MKVRDGICCRCGDECDGSFMRMDPRYSRVRNMLTAPEVPRFRGGGVALCHHCQRAAYFKKDFLSLLIADLERAAKGMRVYGDMKCPSCGHGESYKIKSRGTRKCKSCHHQFSSTSGTKFRYSKMPDSKRELLMDLLQTHSVREAARLADVNYHTAWRHSKLEREE